MNYALLEEAGELKTGTILSEAEASLQVELDSGRRAKVKSAQVFIRFEQPQSRELLPQAQVLERAWDHARLLARKPTLLLRYTRLMFTEHLRRRMQDLLGYGLAMDGLALMEQPES